MVIWQDRLVPVMNTGPLAGDQTIVHALAVLAYQDAAGEPLRYIALAIQTAPVRITVDDQAACELPEENNDFWQAVAKSCFHYEQTPTPILDIKHLCSAEFRDFAAQRLAHLPAPTMRLITDANPEPAAVSDRSTEQAESALAEVVGTVDMPVSLFEDVGQGIADLLDKGEIDDIDPDDDEAVDEVAWLDDDDEAILDDDLDDDLDDGFEGNLDDELKGDLDDEFEGNLDDDLDDDLDDQFDAEELADLAELEDDTDLDDDDLADEMAWLEDDGEALSENSDNEGFARRSASG